MEKKMLLGIALFLLAASVAGYLALRTIPNQFFPDNAVHTKLPASPTPTRIPYPQNGEFTLESDSLQGRVNTPVTLRLVATSGTEEVGGYDVVMSFDKTAFDTQSIQNLVDVFQIFPYNKLPDHLSVSATKDVQVTGKVHFSHTPILQFTFIPKRAGMYVFSLKARGAESCQMVNESTQVTYPATSDIRLEIK